MLRNENIDDAEAEVRHSEDDCDGESGTSCVESLADSSDGAPEVKTSVRFSDEVELHIVPVGSGRTSEVRFWREGNICLSELM